MPQFISLYEVYEKSYKKTIEDHKQLNETIENKNEIVRFTIPANIITYISKSDIKAEYTLATYKIDKEVFSQEEILKKIEETAVYLANQAIVNMENETNNKIYISAPRYTNNEITFKKLDFASIIDDYDQLLNTSIP